MATQTSNLLSPERLRTIPANTLSFGGLSVAALAAATGFMPPDSNYTASQAHNTMAAVSLGWRAPTEVAPQDFVTDDAQVKEEGDDETRDLFNQFVGDWTRDTQNRSDIKSVLVHPAYHKILAMGKSVLPFIFEELAEGGGARWLPALDAITLGKENPVKAEHEDDAYLICQDWLEWGARRGYVAQ